MKLSMHVYAQAVYEPVPVQPWMWQTHGNPVRSHLPLCRAHMSPVPMRLLAHGCHAHLPIHSMIAAATCIAQ